MNKKYTIRDIAKQAGVSVATVSYVINNRDDQRISEKTKKKVLQIINLLDYRPNSSAKSLTTNKTYNVALYLQKEDSLYKRSEQLYVAEALSVVLKEQGYHLLLQSRDDISQLDYADAILCHDISAGSLQEIGDKNLIPLIAIDSLISAPSQIFFQICTDYLRLKELADIHFGTNNYTYVCLPTNNNELKELILSTFSSVQFVGNEGFHIKGNCFYSQYSLSTLFDNNALYLPCDMQSKMQQVFSCIKLALDRIPDCEHIVFV